MLYSLKEFDTELENQYDDGGKYRKQCKYISVSDCLENMLNKRGYKFQLDYERMQQFIADKISMQYTYDASVPYVLSTFKHNPIYVLNEDKVVYIRDYKEVKVAKGTLMSYIKHRKQPLIVTIKGHAMVLVGIGKDQIQFKNNNGNYRLKDISYFDKLIKAYAVIPFVRHYATSSIINGDLSSLLPQVEHKVVSLLKRLSDEGLRMKPFECYRSDTRQNYLYSQGRTRSGEIITNAKAGESYHAYGQAVDLVFKGSGWYEPFRGAWKKFVKIAKEEGFTTGADWGDYPHLQLDAGLSIKELQEGMLPEFNTTFKYNK